MAFLNIFESFTNGPTNTHNPREGANQPEGANKPEGERARGRNGKGAKSQTPSVSYIRKTASVNERYAKATD